MIRLRTAAVVAAALVAVVLAPGPAHAQSVDRAVEDLGSHDVTFEEGAVTDQDVAELDDVTAQLQSDRGYVKVVVLASPVSQHSSTRAFAEKVRAAIGGTGRVVVFDPADVGIASNVPGEAANINDAELAAIDAANRSNSFAVGVVAAAEALGVKGSSAGGGGSGSGGSGSSGSHGTAGSSGASVLLLVLLVAFVGLVGYGFYRWWSARREAAEHRPLTRSPSRGGAEGAQRGRGRLQPGDRAGRSNGGAHRAGGVGQGVPGRRQRVRRPAGRAGGGGHPRGAGGGVPRARARALAARLRQGTARRAGAAGRASARAALPASACSCAGGFPTTRAPLPAAPPAQPVAHRRRHRRHHRPRLARLRPRDRGQPPPAQQRRLVPRPVRGWRRRRRRIAKWNQPRSVAPRISMGGRRSRGMGSR